MNNLLENVGFDGCWKLKYIYEGNNFSRQIRYCCPPQQSAPELINELTGLCTRVPFPPLAHFFNSQINPILPKTTRLPPLVVYWSIGHFPWRAVTKGQEFPMATMSMIPVYFHREQKENETNSQTPWLFSSGPHLLIAYTLQLEILVTSLPWVAAFYMSRIDCLELILFLFYLRIPKTFITFLIVYFCMQPNKSCCSQAYQEKFK